MLITSCVEPFDIKSITHESNLVVNAVITNEFKKHTIKLSRTTKIDSTGINPEKNAIISIIDDSQVVQQFKETENGNYQSINQFKASPDKEYTLKIKTQQGESYSSTPERLTSIVNLESINVNVTENELSEKEVQVSLKNSKTDNTNKYYRFEYEETFKVTPFSWNTQEVVVVIDSFPYEFGLINTSIPKYCYINQKHNKIIITEDQQLTNFIIRNIPLSDRTWSIRYSILVKEYILNEKAYNYYNLLKKFSNPDDIFSQTQVGAIPTNITSDTNSEDKAIGIFEVSSVSSKRIFLNRQELTSKDYKYPEQFDCEPFAPDLFGERETSPLLTALNSGHFTFAGLAPGGTYNLINRPCGDCTNLGSKTKPTFWID